MEIIIIIFLGSLWKLLLLLLLIYGTFGAYRANSGFKQTPQVGGGIGYQVLTKK